ncbi:hypothetical protein P3T76_002981 [Phytophthora citrophthora]|uniref:Uncharacterized protein n=1 Tax=Phytophthora citrophthora TaxID=4793 RepID=A0AAD9GXM2_9STRA|nr:hypothetical protein P3T76_002981 [Phytophthora citrophthora]
MLRQLPRPPSPSQELASPEAPLASSPSGTDALTSVLYSSPPEDSQAVHIQLAQDTELEQSTQLMMRAGAATRISKRMIEAEEEDVSINLFDVDLQQQVAGLISADKCKRRCLEGKAREIEWLTCSLGQMTKAEKTTCILTLIGVLMQTDTAPRRRGTDEREKFHFYLPYVGHVCRTAFAHCLGVQPLTVQRYKRRVREGDIATKEHGNKLNKNASTIDAVWLVRWFKEFASEVGEVVPVRVRMQKTKDGVVNKYYSREDYTLLPPTFTWDVHYDEMHKYVAKGLRVNDPARTTFRNLLSIHCPTIRIRSAQSNVCNLCSVYQTRMRHGATAEQTEALGQHTESARRMRYHFDLRLDTNINLIYYEDKTRVQEGQRRRPQSGRHQQGLGCDRHGLLVEFDGSVGHVNTIAVENEGTQTNYVYDEFASGKGSDQINSMLQHFIRTVLLPAGKKWLIVYADN